MDMVDLETHQSKTIVSADVNYISEVLYNQQVTLIINQEGDTSQIEMLNADQKPMFRAEFVWKDK
jgi:phosphotransferase system IIA component